LQALVVLDERVHVFFRLQIELLDEPRARVVGQAGAWPLERSSGERFLHGVLRGAEITVATDDGAEHLRCKLTEQVLAGRLHRGRLVL
jgi:hypothetical protein